MEQFTYAAIKKPAQRQEMLDEDISSLGTQSGNYGLFTEQARVITISGAKKIASEIKLLCKDEGLDYKSVLEFSPTLEKLLKYSA
jgi:hypothetical protein